VIPYGKQSITQEDIDAVVSVMQSPLIAQGPEVELFEGAVASYVGCSDAIAVNSATSALHISCLALDLGPGDVLWTSPISFVASANCARLCGADVDFVDIDSKTLCMSEEALAEKLQRHKTQGLPLPKIVMPVHFSGQSCNMKAIWELSQQYGFRIIEDAAHGLGGSYTAPGSQATPVGRSDFSDICAFSFHPVKSITTAEGGMACTNSKLLADRLRRIRIHGITRNAAEMTKPTEGLWYYQMLELGLNYRLSDIHAALGRSQLKRLGSFIARRRAIAKQYDKAFEHLPQGFATQCVPSHTESARHLYVLRVPAAERSAMLNELRDEGIGVHVHYIPIHLQPYYQALGFKEGQFPEAERYYSEALSLPIFPDLSDADLSFVIDRVLAAVQRHC
jgi:UDP-4-amino-4,6-dideoxy-N-acetyl-beta-L-altrosamine transaminase